MRRDSCATVAILLTVLGPVMGDGAQAVAADTPKPGEQVACSRRVKTADGAEADLRYWLFAPANYTGKDSSPLLLFLHGAGERGTDLEAVKKWGPPHRVAEEREFPFVVVSPQCPAGARWDVESLADLVDGIVAEQKIDTSRLYCTGLSMGGSGTWAMLAKHPKLFAAGVPICGGGDPATAATIKDIPIWAFHGDQDTAVPVARSQEMIDAIGKLGGKAKLTVYPGVGHNSWSATYDNEDVYTWLLSHRRPVP